MNSVPSPKAGDAFWLADPGFSVAIPHLYVVVHASQDDGFAVSFNFSKYDPAKLLFDATCIVDPAEFPEVLREKSFVVYERGKRFPVADWGRLISLSLGLTSSAPSALVGRMIAGAKISKHTKPIILKALP